MRKLSRTVVLFASTMFMVAALASPGGAVDGLPDLPEPPGAAGATLVNFETLNPPATCTGYFTTRRGDGLVHIWEVCADSTSGELSSVAGTSRIIDDPGDPGAPECNTKRPRYFTTFLQVLDLATDVVELGDDQGDLADFFPGGEFVHELCFFDWSWDENGAEPLIRFW